MKLTPQVKEQIDKMSYWSMLEQVRYAPAGTPIFEGESGTYFLDRMNEMRNEPGGQERHVAASKGIGWDNIKYGEYRK